MSLAHKLILALTVGARSLNRSGPVSRSGKSGPFRARACPTGIVHAGVLRMPTVLLNAGVLRMPTVLLNAGGAQALEAIPIHLRLPAQELLGGQPVAGAGITHRE